MQIFLIILKKKLVTTIGKPVIGNLVDEPLLHIPDESLINKSHRSQLNLLQNTSDFNQIDLNDMRNEIHKNFMGADKQNWSFIFSHEDAFRQLEGQIRNDIRNNGIEMIIVGQTMIASKYLDANQDLKKKIPPENQKQLFTYHGTKLSNHQLIVKKHFLMPGIDKMKNLDGGYFGKGIAATDNVFYAAMYSKEYKMLKYNEQTHVIACLSIYNDTYVKHIYDLSYYGRKLDQDIVNNFGINYSFTGSSSSFKPILESDKNKNFVSCGEFVFGHKYQIIPLYSFTVMRTDHFVLWKDQNIEKTPNSNFMNELLKKTLVNIYTAKSTDEAIKILNDKKRNRVKLIITDDDEDSFSGKLLIEQARKIYQSSFVCLIFSSSKKKFDWVQMMENVLFASSFNDVQRFISMDLDEKNVNNFIEELEMKSNVKFKLNKKELLSFPTTLKTFYE